MLCETWWLNGWCLRLRILRSEFEPSGCCVVFSVQECKWVRASCYRNLTKILGCQHPIQGSSNISTTMRYLLQIWGLNASIDELLSQFCSSMSHMERVDTFDVIHVTCCVDSFFPRAHCACYWCSSTTSQNSCVITTSVSVTSFLLTASRCETSSSVPFHGT